tara:strand:- start:12422 stop:12949 length:528 start_codon:yes stop_codon:yes gene_type:complete
MNVATSVRETFRIRARNTNINDMTLLATDYLNHFNEALMLAEMVGDMPEMLEDFSDWQPCSYLDHFRQSGIADRELAIDAYPYSPSEYRLALERVTHQLDDEIKGLQQYFRETLTANEANSEDAAVVARCQTIRGLIDKAGGIINGYVPKASPALVRKDGKEGPLDQEAISALFG